MKVYICYNNGEIKEIGYKPDDLSIVCIEKEIVIDDNEWQ